MRRGTQRREQIRLAALDRRKRLAANIAGSLLTASLP